MQNISKFLMGVFSRLLLMFVFGEYSAFKPTRIGSRHPDSYIPSSTRTLIFPAVGNISNLGARHFKGTFYQAKGAIPKNKRLLLCLLRNLGGHVPPVPPAPTSLVPSYASGEKIRPYEGNNKSSYHCMCYSVS